MDRERTHFRHDTSNIHLDNSRKREFVFSSLTTASITIGSTVYNLTNLSVFLVGSAIYTGLFFAGKAMVDSMTPDMPSFGDPMAQANDLAAEAEAAEAEAEAEAKAQAQARASRIGLYGQTVFTSNLGDTGESSIYAPSLLQGE